MDTPYQPPSSPLEQPAPDMLSLEWVRYTRWVLWFCGAAYFLMGLFMGPVFAWLSSLDAPGERMPPAVMTMMTIIIFIFSGGFAALNFIAAWGLGQGRKWAWVMGVCIGGIYAPSGCLPFGGLILYGLLNDRVRKAYLG